MARLRAINSTDIENRASANRDLSSAARQSSPVLQRIQSSSSPTPSVSSDKENRAGPRSARKAMPDSSFATPDANHGVRSNKRQRIQVNGGQRPQREQPPPLSQVEIDEQEDLKHYDPDQDPEERRLALKGMRELTRDLQDSRPNYLNPDNDGLHDTIRQQNELFSSVKQTNDACMDSRLLTNVSDLAYKKSQLAARGEGHGQGIDVDDFVSKCISFMRQGGEPRRGISSTQRTRAGGRGANDDDEEEDGDIGDALNWEWLGTQACFPVNSRPPAPAFLLGPLSVQKRVRAPRVRKERSQKQAHVETTRPEELKVADLERNEKSNLVSLCKNIYKHMNTLRNTASAQAEEEASHLGAESTDADVLKILARHDLCDDGGLQLMKFALHPTSFGQTVENLFYISFLIKDNMVGVNTDEQGMISMHDSNQGEGDTAGKGTGRAGERQPGMRHQAIFSLDFETWQDLVKVMNIEEPMIPDRGGVENTTQVSARGWYG